MRKPVAFAIATLFLLVSQMAGAAQSGLSSVVVFSEPGFPAADSAAPSPQQLAAISSDAQLASANQLPAALTAPAAPLLILPYGSAFPEQAWPAIKQFLDRGGNLLVFGGKPFTRAAYRDSKGWHLRDYSVRFIRPLMIDQYQETPGSDGFAVPAQPRADLAASRLSMEACLQPRNSTQRGRSLPSRRSRRFHRRAPRLSRLGRKERSQAVSACPSRSITIETVSMADAGFSSTRNSRSSSSTTPASCNLSRNGHSRALRNSPCAPRCPSTCPASP